MKNAKEFLRILTILVPPGERQHHALTLNYAGDGELLVTLFTGPAKWTSFTLDDQDVAMPPGDLARAVADAFTEEREKGRCEPV